MNVLCDRHHAGLYRSMQLLSTRLGWNLYTPVGREWATEGYWQFGFRAYGDDRLAVQYLEPHEGVWRRLEATLLTDGYWETEDAEFPVWTPDQVRDGEHRKGASSKIIGVTLEQARKMPWAFVIATVDDNQWGFHRFAQEVGAQYVYQVGNTNQYVDWSLDPIALVSSEVPIRGRGIRYHQEMDAAVTKFREPYLANRASVSSFVNCFPQIRRDHPYIGEAWDAAKALLPEYEFAEYGIDGADGIQKPIGLFADRMALSGWIWHDKPQGDGFGHVIHSAAAIGRPLIGHGSHYAGKMAEAFWLDGETCIDLDHHTIEEAVQIIRGTTPEKHAAMCRSIRVLFDLFVDYSSEAEQIRELTARGAVAEMSMA